ncbi:MAG: cysteine desulfurase [Chromatiales bacterium]|nr:cysteine desulfurase [Chromatiales bacterium]
MLHHYFDHNATSPLASEVLEAMLPFLQQEHGNPSSQHRHGRAARAAIERARAQVASLIGARPGEIVFTGSGTEANNLALKGIAATMSPGISPGALAVAAIEHSSVLGAARSLERAGWRLAQVQPDTQGRVTAALLDAALLPATRLVSVIGANNETGVIQDMPALSAVAARCGALFHCDAVQAAGRIPLDFAASGVHLMSLSAHKLGGPKGVGALAVHRSVDIESLLHGGGQESGRRSGTENVAGIVGFGRAAELVARGIETRARHLRALRERLETQLREIPGVEIFGAQAERLPNTSCFAVDGVDGGTLVLKLDEAGFAVSSGSACGSASPEPSHVLLAMGVTRERAYGALRVSFGMENDVAAVDAFAACLRVQIGQLRQSLGGFATGV